MTAGTTRRGFLRGAATGCLAGAATLVHPRLAFASGRAAPAGDVVVLVSLRGGLDGLSLLVPYSDDYYHSARPTTGVPKLSVRRLDDRFGLPPAANPLRKAWDRGELAFIPACGLPDPSRSHFVQQSALDRGVVGRHDVTTGWLARHLATAGGTGSDLRGTAISNNSPPSMLGSPRTLTTVSLTNAAVGSTIPAGFATPAHKEALLRLAGDGPWATSAAEALAAVRAIQTTEPWRIGAANGASYDGMWWSTQLRQVAQLIRSGVGLEAAVVELGGFDVHSGMGAFGAGTQHTLIAQLSNALGSFYEDTLDLPVTVVVVSEFGRRVSENASNGTDHGAGGLTMVLGRGASGGIHGWWPGLAPDALDRGDVQVTTDVRNVLAEVVQLRLRNPALDVVFPGLQVAPVGAVRG